MLKNPIILALDVDHDEQAFQIFNQVKDLIGAVKVGPRLGYKYGSAFTQKLAESTPVFIDNKYFDITSTMVAAVKTSFEAGATLVTVHSLSSLQTLTELAKLEKELNQKRPFKILAISILTSWDQSNFVDSFKPMSVSDHVQTLAQVVSRSGLSGIVSSGHELKLIQKYPFFKVTPGIRLPEAGASNKEDQKRIMTPQEAVSEGASGIVIGRPILESKDPRGTVQKILESLN